MKHHKWRTLVRVEARSKDHISCILSAWNPDKRVVIPLDCIDNREVRDFVVDVHNKMPIRLFAYCNIGCENADQLEFESFEIAPEPDESILRSE